MKINVIIDFTRKLRVSSAVIMIKIRRRHVSYLTPLPRKTKGNYLKQLRDLNPAIIKNPCGGIRELVLSRFL